MIGSKIPHYKILEKLGEVLLRLSFVGQGGLVRRSFFIKTEVINDWK